jgi:hypothetical protein
MTKERDNEEQAEGGLEGEKRYSILDRELESPQTAKTGRR